MRCPRCRSELTRIRDVDACLRCGGAFLAAAAVDTVRRAVDDDAHATVEIVEQQGGRRSVNTAGAAPCPGCGEAMQRFRVGPVEVDTCLAHGSWYDRGELLAVRDALLAGLPSEEIDVDAPPAQAPAAAAARTSSGLELDHAQLEHAKRAPPPSPRAGGIDPGAQAAIAKLQAHEATERERERWRHRRRWGFGRRRIGDDPLRDAVDVVDDVLSVLF